MSTYPANYREEHKRLKRLNSDLLEALEQLVWIIDKAGLSNLSNGVQLGQISWHMKANDRLEAARSAIRKATEGGA